MDDFKRQYTCLFGCTIFLMLFLQKTTNAQHFTIDTATTIFQKQPDTIPEIMVYGKRLNPNEKIITFSTFEHSFLLNNLRRITTSSSFFKENTIYIYPFCIPISNKKGFAVQIDSIYIKGSNMPPDKVLLYFNLYKDNKRIQTQTASKFHRRKKINVFIFNQSIRLPEGESYLSFDYKLIDTPFDFTIATNSLINGVLYSYNKERNEFNLTDSVLSYYDNKPEDHWIESTKNNPHFSAPQVKIFCSLIKK